MKTLVRVVSKSAWPLADRLVRLVLAIGVGVIVARHLGPEQFGLLSFAVAWASFFGGLAWLGLGEAVTRDIVQTPSETQRILSTVSALRLLGSLAALSLAVLLLPVFFPDQFRTAWLIVLIIAFAGVFNEPGGVATIWMVATSRTGLIATTRTLPHVVAQLFRLALVAGGASVVWFAVAVPLEALIVLALSWWAYARATGTSLAFRLEWPLARSLLLQSLPTLMAALATGLSLRIDQMMLASLSGFEDVGIYAAALRFSEVWWMIPTAIMQVAAPMLLFGNDNEKSRKNYLLAMYGVLLATAAIIAVVTTVVGSRLIDLLLGAEFEGASAVLVVHVWTALFVFVDSVAMPELVRQHAQRTLMCKAIVVLAVNAALNALWIPSHGALGAAWATLAAMALGVVVFCVLSRPYREQVVLQVLSVPWLLQRAWQRRPWPRRR